MLLANLLGPLLMQQAGGDGGAGGGSGAGAGDGGGQSGTGQSGGGSIMNRGGDGGGSPGGDAGAGGQGGDAGAAGAGGAGAGGEGSQGAGAGSGAGDDRGTAGDQGKQPPAGDQSWQWADGIPGTGERPPWFKADKYQTVDQQARAAAELEAKLGPAAELIGAPEGDYAIPAAPEGVAGDLDPADPLLKAFSTTAKELGLSQKAYDAVVQAGAKAVAEQNAADEAKLSEALAELGTNVDQRVAHVQQVLTKHYGEEGFAALDQAIGNNAGAFKALEQLVMKAHGDAQLAGGAGQAGPAFTKSDVETEQYKTYPEGHKLAGQRVYDHDAEHRKKVDAMWKQLFPGEDVQRVG